MSFFPSLSEWAAHKNISIVMDDLLVWGSTDTEHDARLIKVLDQARKVKLQLKLKKLQFKVPEVGYLGYLTNLSHSHVMRRKVD